MPTRRTFLMNSALVAHSPSLLAGAEEPRLPVGVIEPYQWGDREIPVQGTKTRGASVIDKRVTEAMRQNGIVGCGVCVVRGSQLVYASGYGYAELPGTPFLPTTASRCGSIVKSMTSLCALLLADQGKLRLDDFVLPLLQPVGITPRPSGSSKPDERLTKIRVRHLMDHTSGLPRGATYTAWVAGRNVAEAQNLKHVASAADVARDALSTATLDSAPGEKFQYANANYVLLARVIEAASTMTFNDFLTRLAMPRFGVKPGQIYVSSNQESPRSPARGKNEAAYYQTGKQRFVSFIPSEKNKGRVYGEAYRGYASESSDGAGGIACSAEGIAKILTNLASTQPALSPRSLAEITTPPAYYNNQADFDPAEKGFYSKGFNVRLIAGRPWLAHGGMTLHCGGVLGHNAGYQFAAVSNWNNAEQPFVDTLLDRALAEAMRDL